jgi:hypothetical protein
VPFIVRREATKEGKYEFLVISMGPNRKCRFQADGNLVVTGGGKHWASNTWEPVK